MMPDKPPTDSSLAALRAEIDHIDETMHGLLMQRGEIIDRLIAVKQTQESGSAFRPAREAEMMRRLVDRHHGILPLDTAESIWRVIISTFTYVQAPFSIHADLTEQPRSDARLRALPFRFHRAFRRAYRCGWCGCSGVGITRRSWSGKRARGAAAPGGRRWNSTARRKSSRGCLSLIATTIRLRCPYL